MKAFAGQVRWIAELGRIGFMSTQRREDRSLPTTQTGSRRCGIRWQRTHCMRLATVVTDFNPGRTARDGRAMGCAETAPPIPLAASATSPLQMDHPHTKFVWPVEADRWASPESSGTAAVSIRQATRRTLLPLIPILSDSALSYQALPQDPAADSRRAERYDGKGNLYFKHAA